MHRTITRITMAALVATSAALALAADAPDKAAVDKAFDALKSYDWGQERKDLDPIDDAVAAAHGNAALRKDLETRLVAVVKGSGSRAAKDFACRKLRIIGSAECVPALAGLLADKELSHMARYALEPNPAPEAAAALRDALPKVSGALKIGVVVSLGARRDAAAAAPLAALLGDADAALVRAAVVSLGKIGSAEAGKALADAAAKAPAGVKACVADARLACAEQLAADGKKADALAIYTALSGPDQPKEVRLAATRGRLALAGKKE